MESTSSKPTLLEDQRKECKDIVVGFSTMQLRETLVLVLYYASYNANDSYAYTQ